MAPKIGVRGAETDRFGADGCREEMSVEFGLLKDTMRHGRKKRGKRRTNLAGSTHSCSGCGDVSNGKGQSSDVKELENHFDADSEDERDGHLSDFLYRRSCSSRKMLNRYIVAKSSSNSAVCT